MIDIRNGNCLDLLKTLPDNSVDSIVTDPPYGLSFMGKKWDYDVPSQEIWEECLRVLKPGGHLLAFAGTRTQHRMAVRIEDAGFEIRDMIAWTHGSGFPKSMDVSKAIDKAAGAEREVVGETPNHLAVSGVEYEGVYHGGNTGAANITAPATEAAHQWQGWGTALKPALEPITVARKPLIGTVAENVITYGTGALNIDGCRVELNGDYKSKANGRPSQTGLGDNYDPLLANRPDTIGRWPANLIHDGSDDVVKMFPQSKGTANGGKSERNSKNSETYWGEGGGGFKGGRSTVAHADAGSASRFFYCAKASKRERSEGMSNGTNTHPTVKPIALMEYLCKLVTQPGGIILDPFLGSGTTGKAAKNLGYSFIGFELTPEYFEIASQRINGNDAPEPEDEAPDTGEDSSWFD